VHAGYAGAMAGVPSDEVSNRQALGKADVSPASGFTHRLVLVRGTSSCHLAVSEKEVFVEGVWGPFWSGGCALA
jgi:ribulose kinase